MADFLPAVEITLQHEGGYVDNPCDKGGSTNAGITQRDMPGVDLHTLTHEEIVSFYEKRYWLLGMSQLVSQLVANKLFDMGVLLSPPTSVRLLQRALGFATSAQNGTLGLSTIASANDAGDNLLPDYKRVLVNHFNWIVETNPSQQVFLAGWMNRIES